VLSSCSSNKSFIPKYVRIIAIADNTVVIGDVTIVIPVTNIFIILII